MSLSAYDELLKDLGVRCNITDIKICRKSKELVTLLNCKRSINCSETCKMLVCIELAASKTPGTFNREMAVKLSGCTVRNYVKHFNNISKLLNLNKTYTIKEICLLVGAPDVSDKSQDLFKKYQSIVCHESIPLEHPMYACAAILAVCQEENHLVNMQKLVSISKIKKLELKILSKKFSQLLKKKICYVPKRNMERRVNECKKYLAEHKDDNCTGSREVMSDEQYEEWKKRMLEGE